MGWDSSDLDKMGSFAKIDINEQTKDLCVYSLNKRNPRWVRLEDIIQAGDKLKFAKTLQYEKNHPAFSGNPLKWLLIVILTGIERIYSVFNKGYKRLNSLECSLDGFKNPSNNLNDFPFAKFLDVKFINGNYKDINNQPGVIVEDPENNERWTMTFDVFSNVTQIEIEKGSNAN